MVLLLSTPDYGQQRVERFGPAEGPAREAEAAAEAAAPAASPAPVAVTAVDVGPPAAPYGPLPREVVMGNSRLHRHLLFG